MVKIAKQTTTAPSAWVVNPSDRGRKSIKNGKVYLSDKSEFVIELYNPLQYCVLADIKLNGSAISKTGLILKPGQRFYLDCFIDDKKKFVFNTYEVEDTDETSSAIAKNGLLEVFFYKESVVTVNNWQNRFGTTTIINNNPWYPWGGTYYGSDQYYGKVYCSTTLSSPSFTSSTLTGTSTGTSNLSNLGCVTNTIAGNSFSAGVTSTGYFDCSNLNISNSSNSQNTLSIADTNPVKNDIETGRVEKGNASNQKFKEVDMDFEKYYIASTIVQLLPESRKPIETSDINKGVSLTKLESVELLLKLGELLEKGILTKEEFNEKKKELLSKI